MLRSLVSTSRQVQTLLTTRTSDVKEITQRNTCENSGNIMNPKANFTSLNLTFRWVDGSQWVKSKINAASNITFKKELHELGFFLFHTRYGIGEQASPPLNTPWSHSILLMTSFHDYYSVYINLMLRHLSPKCIMDHLLLNGVISFFMVLVTIRSKSGRPS